MPPRDARARAVERLQQQGRALPFRQPEPPHPAEDELPSPEMLAETQVEGAIDLLARDLSKAPRWGWPDVNHVLGPMMPGDLVIVGALMGNGKSTLLMSQMDSFAEAKMPTLYFPLEVDPEICRLHWASWKLGFNRTLVVQQDWSRLPEGAREAVGGILEEQLANPYIHFATPKRLDWPAFARWCKWAKDRCAARAVMIDHFHRIQIAASQNYRVDATEFARKIKDLGRELGLVMICAAQLNRSNDPVDPFVAPTLARLKETSGLGEEADVAIMLSRRLKPDLPKHWLQDLRLGRMTERDIAEPATMTITCRKHRLDDAALNRSVFLTVDNGKLRSRTRSWQQPPAA